MRTTSEIERLLSETPVPRLSGGAHRAALKQELLAGMQSPESARAGGVTTWWRLIRPKWIAAAAAIAAVAISAGIVLVKRTSGPATVATREPGHLNLTATAPSSAGGGAVDQPPATSRPLTERRLTESLRRKSIDQSVAEAQVIVVGTALDSALAPPKVRGDLPENFIRFRVQRVLKGKLDQEIITTRTPTAAAEFIGRDWIIMLSPEYMAGKHFYAGCYTLKLEPEVKAILARDAK